MSISQTQHYMYSWLRNFSNENKALGRLLSVPVALAEASLEIVAYPLAAIKAVAKAAFQLINAVFNLDIKALKQALKYSEQALIHTVSTPVKLALSPLKFAFQTLVIAIDPANARPFHAADCYVQHY